MPTICCDANNRNFIKYVRNCPSISLHWLLKWKIDSSTIITWLAYEIHNGLLTWHCSQNMHNCQSISIQRKLIVLKARYNVLYRRLTEASDTVCNKWQFPLSKRRTSEGSIKLEISYTKQMSTMPIFELYAHFLRHYATSIGTCITERHRPGWHIVVGQRVLPVWMPVYSLDCVGFQHWPAAAHCIMNSSLVESWLTGLH